MQIQEDIFRQFFESELTAVLQKRSEQIKVNSSFFQLSLPYVIGVLVRFYQAEEFKSCLTTTPLFDLAKLIYQDFSLIKIQGLADYCLFRTGIFPLNFNTRKAPPRKNFIYAGQKAYWKLSKHFSDNTNLFGELSKKFVFFSNLISETRISDLSQNELLELYDLWLETGNQGAAEQLIKMGIKPQKIQFS